MTGRLRISCSKSIRGMSSLGVGWFGDEAVTRSPNRHDVLRRGRVDFDDLPQSEHKVVDRANGDVRVVVPDRVEDVQTRQNLALMLKKVAEEDHHLRGQ